MDRTFIVLFFAIIQILPSDGLVTYRFVKANCSTSGVGTCIEPFCIIKPISRQVSLLSAGCRSLKTAIPKLYLSFNLMYKRNFGNYRQLIELPWTEMCQFLKGYRTPMSDFLDEWIFHNKGQYKCPMTGDNFEVKNLTYKPDLVSVWPDGLYRFTSIFMADFDEKIYSVTGVLEVKNVNNIKEFK